MSSDRTFGVSVRWRWRSASRSEGKPAVGTASGERESIVVLRTLTEKNQVFSSMFYNVPVRPVLPSKGMRPQLIGCALIAVN